jgi:anaerobic selenocysteine-containing dehydrogenase
MPSNPVMDVMQADVVLLIGANPVSNHPSRRCGSERGEERDRDPRRPARSEFAWYAMHYQRSSLI